MDGRINFLHFVMTRSLAHELHGFKAGTGRTAGQECGGDLHTRRAMGQGGCLQHAPGLGTKRVYVSEPWIADEVHGVKVIGRFMVRRTTSRAEADADDRARPAGTMEAERCMHSLREALWGLLGDGLYHRLWCRLTGYDEFEATRPGIDT